MAYAKICLISREKAIFYLPFATPFANENANKPLNKVILFYLLFSGANKFFSSPVGNRYKTFLFAPVLGIIFTSNSCNVHLLNNLETFDVS